MLSSHFPAGQFYPSDLDPNNTTAFVGNVNEDVTEEDLNQVFWRCGDIRNIKLLRAKGCAFVTYAERSSAERAIKELHGKVHPSSACCLLPCTNPNFLQGRPSTQFPIMQSTDSLGFSSWLPISALLCLWLYTPCILEKQAADWSCAEIGMLIWRASRLASCIL